jgi:hypothetical protein
LFHRISIPVTDSATDFFNNNENSDRVLFGKKKKTSSSSSTSGTIVNSGQNNNNNAYHSPSNNNNDTDRFGGGGGADVTLNDKFENHSPLLSSSPPRASSSTTYSVSAEKRPSTVPKLKMTAISPKKGGLIGLFNNQEEPDILLLEDSNNNNNSSNSFHQNRSRSQSMSMSGGLGGSRTHGAVYNHRVLPSATSHAHRHKLTLQQQMDAQRRAAIIRGDLEEKPDGWLDVCRDVLAYNELLNKPKPADVITCSVSGSGGENDAQVKKEKFVKQKKEGLISKSIFLRPKVDIEDKEDKEAEDDDGNDDNDDDDDAAAAYMQLDNHYHFAKTTNEQVKKKAIKTSSTSSDPYPEGFSCAHVGERWHSHKPIRSPIWPDRLVSALFAEKLLKELKFLSPIQEVKGVCVSHAILVLLDSCIFQAL